jgi:hypothetical protein
MPKYALIAVTVVCAVAAAAPAAQAQPQSFNATYTNNFGTLAGTHPCPDGAFACGKGTAAGFGAFSYQVVPNSDGTFTSTLTFADGSTLSLQETLVAFSTPGASGDQQPAHAFGHPFTFLLAYNVVSGSGTFAEAVGSGTDNGSGAGNVAHGTLSGTITL